MTSQPNIPKTMKTNELKYTTQITDSDNNKDGFSAVLMK